MAWSNADLQCRDARNYFAPKHITVKRPMGRPKKFGEVLQCYRSPRVWCWHDFVDADHADAAYKFCSDWRASGLGPLQAQQFVNERGTFSSMASRTSTDFRYDDLESEPIGAAVRGRPDAAFKDSVSRTLNEKGTREIRFGRVENDPDDVCCQIEEALGGKGLADEQRLGVDVSMAYEEAKSVALDARRRTARRMSPAEVERLIDEWLVAGNEVKTKENDPRLRPYRLKSGRLAPGAPHPPGAKLRINARGVKQAAGMDGMKILPDPESRDQWPVDDDAGRRRLEWRWARQMLDSDDERWFVEHVILYGIEPIAGRETIWIADLRAALGKLNAHYRRHDYEGYVETKLSVERRKAKRCLR